MIFVATLADSFFHFLLSKSQPATPSPFRPPHPPTHPPLPFALNSFISDVTFIFRSSIAVLFLPVFAEVNSSSQRINGQKNYPDLDQLKKVDLLTLMFSLDLPSYKKKKTHTPKTSISCAFTVHIYTYVSYRIPSKTAPQSHFCILHLFFF